MSPGEPVKVYYRYHEETGQRENWVYANRRFTLVLEDGGDGEYTGQRPNSSFKKL